MASLGILNWKGDTDPCCKRVDVSLSTSRLTGSPKTCFILCSSSKDKKVGLGKSRFAQISFNESKTP
ncbi:hypothetical protein MSHOH_1840 [Methanosarcina horonobensis HB-1 = JCM 15518]|uniref:Uncharacterized protein n=1 Tax=Methanosarcina horonobensis HB-1 = JCM 15518 TaxID=1434110 RepID=A0A0E3SFN9_9EURY|nr:hypothetical protein MSHOH_1840 [Methanosarcina horonobensis HB-1 = JCM 15518]